MPAALRLMKPPNRLRAIREERNLRLIDLAWIIKITTGQKVAVATLSRLETGNTPGSWELKAAIARALRVPPEKLWEVDHAS